VIRISRWHVVVGLALASTLALSGCAGDSASTGESSGLTLEATKPATQLLRNEIGSRVPEAMLQEVVQSKDGSSACNTEHTDPKGLLRAWHSSARLQLVYDPTIDVDSVIEDIVASFVEQGWDAGAFQSTHIAELKSDTTFVTIHLSGNKENVDTGEGATIQVRTTGPCVDTDGIGSDELKLLGETGTEDADAEVDADN
jgi:hypothetical protein